MFRLNPGGASRPSIHFSGIGGTAMVAGARLAIEAGWEVRGSDNPLYPPTSHMVEALGVPVANGYAAANLDWRPDCVILGNALSRGNPEVEAALTRKLHYLSLPEWLKDAVLRTRRPVVIAGTHGKTTTTALAAYLLDASGAEPGFLIGGQPLNFPHSARLGMEEAPFVIEGDEYDTAFFDKRAKFFHYLPEIAVVTSLEFDHADIYPDLDSIIRAFRLMLRQIPHEGRLIVCADDPNALALREHAHCPVESYGFDAAADWRGELAPFSGMPGGCVGLRVHRSGALWGDVTVPMAGRHNLRNALAAIAACAALGMSAADIAHAMPGFQGVKRRMEVFLEARGITFVDDFAHHPTAIRETIAAARQRWPRRKLHVLFEPRSNTAVTNRFQPEMNSAFREADAVWLGPIHRAETIPESQRLDRAAIVRALEQEGVPAAFTDDVGEIVAGLEASVASGDVVLILSNGAFGGIYDRLRKTYER
ncbi:MAG TPA: UDP-N-acetylmuramate:L-alanyl-gamma-D-glutamyl-meso-diaminopimelate ligase [Candidatus Hydrogenedentes bacterium]|nr:UDP-N-acetylmuramate:L-alanyl-gamma-D-glutamyl-meso-diaminopimelate ligase [Candidatus Hydrogenedentota bacterium]